MAMIETEKPFVFERTNFTEMSRIVDELVKSNNEQEERLRRLEPAQQSFNIELVQQPIRIEGICHCDKPMSGLGSKNCLRCGYVLVQQA